MRQHAKDMHALDEALEAAVFGPFDPKLGDKVRDPEQGMQHQLKELYCRSENGGLPARLTGRDRKLIVGTATTVVTALVLDILAHV